MHLWDYWYYFFFFLIIKRILLEKRKSQSSIQGITGIMNGISLAMT
jgi:hypothetical protein